MLNMDMRQGYSPSAIRIYDRKKDAVFEEISLIALDKKNNKVAGVGREVLSLADNSDCDIIVLSPLRLGIVADYELARVMFQRMLDRALLLKKFFKPKTAVCVPAGITEVERKAVEQVFYQAGAGKVEIFEESVERMNQVLASSYRVLVDIIPNEKGERVKKEIWTEVCRNRIPSGLYQIASVSNDNSEIIVLLSSSTDVAEIKFYGVFAARMITKEAIPDKLFSEEEMKKFRKDCFKNRIYEIKGGEFSSLMTEKSRRTGMTGMHYIIIGENAVVEILAGKAPDILTYHTQTD